MADETGEEAEGLEVPLNARQLEGLQHGVGARIMPVHDGWKVDYFSLDFEQEPGTTYESLTEALGAIAGLLLSVNTDEQRAKARDLDEILWAQRHERMQTPSESE